MRMTRDIKPELIRHILQGKTREAIINPAQGRSDLHPS